MTTSQMLDKLRRLSGKTDRDQLLSALTLASEEVWCSMDIPGSLREIRVRTNGDMYATLPWQVYLPRAVWSIDDQMSLELNTIHPAYHNYSWADSPWNARVVRTQPLQVPITNASVLKFRLKAALDVDVSFNVIGETDLASRRVETVEIIAGETEGTTIGNYVDVPEAITKSAPTDYDAEILDADDTLLALFPNHLVNCSYILLHFLQFDCCNTSITSACFDVLFKPHVPVLVDDNDDFPSPFAQVVVFKALEQLNMDHEDKVPIAAAYNEKALAIANQFSEDIMRGKTIKQRKTRNPFADHCTHGI